MPEARKIKWQGKSGKSYEYRIYPMGTTFKAEPGNYVFAKETKPKTWAAIYVGESSNLDERVGSGLDNHEKLPCAKREGATHVHVKLTSGGVAARRAEEEDIREAHDPPCNKE